MPAILLSSAAALQATAQHEVWVRQFGTSGSDGAFCLASDGSGGVIAGGYTSGDLGGPNAGDLDAWLARYDGSGAQLWIHQFGTSEMDTLWASAPDGSGGVFLSGQTRGSLGGANAGELDAWLGHYDGAGNRLWIHQLGTSAHDDATSLAPDGAGGTYVGGTTEGDLGGPSNGNVDAWVARYDSLGKQLWILQLGTTSFEELHAAATDDAGGVYFVGVTGGALGGPLSGPSAAWLARFDGAGNQTWIRQFGSVDGEVATSAAPDGSGGVFVGGQTFGSFGGPSAGSADIFLVRYDSAGNQLWVRQRGTIAEDRPSVSAPDGAGGVYTGGAYNQGFGRSDGWLDQHDSAGSLGWTRLFSTGSIDIVFGAAPQGGGGVYISGYTNGNLGGPSAGDIDAWVARWEPGCGTASATLRNSGPNPLSLQASAPVLGRLFTATVDLTTTGHHWAVLSCYDGAVDIALGGGQHLLCADLHGNGLLYRSVQPGPLALYSIPVPTDLSLCGLRASMQAVHMGAVRPFALSNAQDLVFGN